MTGSIGTTIVLLRSISVMTVVVGNDVELSTMVLALSLLEMVVSL
jgi:hypothetical protein